MTRDWTSFNASADTRVVYVSSSTGDDANDGLALDRPKRTVAAAKELLRHGFPDWLLLRCGDLWFEGLGQWKKSGRSRAEPMLISSYGDEPQRPRLFTGIEPGVITHNGGGSPKSIDYLAIVGLHFAGRDENGATFTQPGSHVLIEDCMFAGYARNLVFQGPGLVDFKLRRSVIVDAREEHGGHSQGLYAYGVDGLLIEECCFDHNGNPTVFCHSLYIDNENTRVIVRGNIIASSGSHGLQLRCGGDASGNLFARNPIALSVGGGDRPNPGGVGCSVNGNVILDGTNIADDLPRGWGLWFGNIRSGRATKNLVANNGTGAQPTVLTLQGPIRDLSVVGNVWSNWGGGVQKSGDVDAALLDNSEAEPSRRRTLASYSKAQNGPGTHEAFMEEARAQSRATWHPEYMAENVNKWMWT